MNETSVEDVVERLRNLVPFSPLAPSSEYEAACRQAADALTALKSERDEAVRTLSGLRDRYASQAKFADPEPAAYFRDFARELSQVHARLKGAE